jgi:hypothetical protein
MRNYFAELQRVDTVAFRIRVANRAFCRERVAGQIGVFAATRRSRSFASEAMNLTWVRPTIISLVEGSPAAQARIRDHDEIVAFNGPSSSRSPARRNGWTSGSSATAKSLEGQSVPRRRGYDGHRYARDRLRDNRRGERFTDGEKILVNSGVAALAKTDGAVGHCDRPRTRPHLARALQQKARQCIAGTRRRARR